MAIRGKARRKISVLGRTFYWWVSQEKQRLLHIASPDKKFLVAIGLDDASYLKEHALPENEEQKPLPEDIGPSPLWEGSGERITPRYIRQVILWYLSPEELAKERWRERMRTKGKKGPGSPIP